MKNIILQTIFLSTLIIGLSSCSGCVKETSKKAAELSLSAVEGVVEAVDEHGDKLAEKTTDAAGKLAEGIGRSLEKQLNEHATKVGSVAGRTTVQAMDGMLGGLTEEGMDTYYNDLPYTENLVSGVSISYFAKYKNSPLIDAYFIVPDEENYTATFECVNTSGDIFLTKEITLKTKDKPKKYSLVSFTLNSQEEQSFKDLKNVKITVRDKK